MQFKQVLAVRLRHPARGAGASQGGTGLILCDWFRGWLRVRGEGLCRRVGQVGNQAWRTPVQVNKITIVCFNAIAYEAQAIGWRKECTKEGLCLTLRQPPGCWAGRKIERGAHVAGGGLMQHPGNIM